MPYYHLQSKQFFLDLKRLEALCEEEARQHSLATEMNGRVSIYEGEACSD